MNYFLVCLFVVAIVTGWNTALCKRQDTNSTGNGVVSRITGYLSAFGNCDDEDEIMENGFENRKKEEVSIPSPPPVANPSNPRQKNQLMIPEVSVCPFIANSSIAILRNVKCNEFMEDLRAYNLDMAKSPIRFATLTNRNSSGQVCFKLDEPGNITIGPEPSLVAMCVPNSNWSISPRDNNTSKYLSLDEFEKSGGDVVVGKRNPREEIQETAQSHFNSSEVDFALCWKGAVAKTSNGSNSTDHTMKDMCIASKSKSLIMRENDFCLLHEWRSELKDKNEHCFPPEALIKPKATRPIFSLFSFFQKGAFFGKNKTEEDDRNKNVESV